MSISEKLITIQSDITNAQSKITSKGGTVSGGSSNLSSDILTIPTNVDDVEFLSSIESTNGQYIDTGLSLPNGFKLEAKIRIISTSKTGVDFAGIFGCQNNSSPWGMQFLRAGSPFSCGFGSASINISIDNPTTVDHIIEYQSYKGDSYFKVDDVIKCTSTDTAARTSNNLYLFGYNSGRGGATSNNRWYYCKIWDENGILVRDYIPIYDSFIGQNGFVDLVNNTMYFSKTSSIFTSGTAQTKSGTLTITESGTYDVLGYEKVIVNI